MYYVNYWKRIKPTLGGDPEKCAQEARNIINTSTLSSYETYAINTIAKNFKHGLRWGTDVYSKLNLDSDAVIPQPFLTEQYTMFKIPKSSGGFREIHAPGPELKTLQKALAQHIIRDTKYLSHNAVHSQSRRNCKTAIAAHKKRGARFFLKLDIKDFFPSCTKDVVLNAFNRMLNTAHLTDYTIKNALDICFLNDALPQGSPCSPVISNIVMQHFDYEFNKWCAERHLCYTRYVDDLLISCASPFDWREVEQVVSDMLPITMELKRNKTRYGSCNGSNWNLGLMYNKDLEVTVGHRAKHTIKCAYHNLYRDKPEDFEAQLASLIGLFQYFKYIEPEYFSKLETVLNAKGYKTI